MRIWKQKPRQHAPAGGTPKLVVMFLLIVLLSAFLVMLMAASGDKKPSGIETWEKAYDSVPPAQTQRMVDYINAPMLEEEPNYSLDITITHKWE